MAVAPPSPPTPWKRQPPLDPAERRTAELLAKVGAAPTLSATAEARLRSRLQTLARRPTVRRGPSFLWVLAAGGALAAAALVWLAGTPRAARHSLDGDRPASPERLALNDAPAAQQAESEAQPAPETQAVREAIRRPSQKKEAKGSSAEGVRASPPSGSSDTRGSALAAGAMSTPAAPAPGAGPKGLQSSRGAVERSADRSSTTRCALELPRLDLQLAEGEAAVPRSDPAWELALFERGRCRLELGDIPGGRLDLQRYLDQFRSGRFRPEAEKLLRR